MVLQDTLTAVRTITIASTVVINTTVVEPTVVVPMDTNTAKLGARVTIDIPVV